MTPAARNLTPATGVRFRAIAKPVAADQSKFRALIWKLSLDGSLEWVRMWGIGSDNVAIAAYYSATEPTFAGWTRFPNGTSRMTLLTYSPGGSLRSEGIYGDSWLENMAWCVTRAGEFTYIAGHYSNSLIFMDNVAITYKIGVDGSVLWWASYGGQRADAVRGVAVLGDMVYVAGESELDYLKRQVFVVAYESPNSLSNPLLANGAFTLPLLLGFALLIVLTLEIYLKQSNH